MKIIRNGLEFELTPEEIAKAHDEFVMSFMKKQVIENYGIKDEGLAEELARNAYNRNKAPSSNMSGGCYVILQK